MEAFGVLEMVLGAAYPYRFAIGGGVVLSLVVLAYVAWRYRWFAAMARRPWLTGGAVAALLVVGVPLTWVLASPLVTTVEAREALPIADATTVRSAALRGADEFHFAEGNVRIVEVDGQRRLVFEDVRLRNGPDLYVYLSPNPQGWDRTAIELGRLTGTQGSFSYAIPPEVRLDEVRSAVVWCRGFAVLFATATLS